MNPLLPLAGVMWLSTASSPLCWAPSDQTAGWKRVDLPKEGPALYASNDVDQFRSGEAVQWFESDPRTYAGAMKSSPGRMAYTFRFPQGTTRLELHFLESLRGAKVDATASAGGRTFPLLSEKRQPGESLVLEWYPEDVDGVVVEVHHHLRETPVVRSWRTARTVWPGREDFVPASFKVPRSLYFLHPGGGKRIVLCNWPGRALALTRWPTEGAPMDVAIKPGFVY